MPFCVSSKAVCSAFQAAAPKKKLPGNKTATYSIGFNRRIPRARAFEEVSSIKSLREKITIRKKILKTRRKKTK